MIVGIFGKEEAGHPAIEDWPAVEDVIRKGVDDRGRIEAYRNRLDRTIARLARPACVGGNALNLAARARYIGECSSVIKLGANQRIFAGDQVVGYTGSDVV